MGPFSVRLSHSFVISPEEGQRRGSGDKKGASKQAAYGGERIPGLTVLGKERSVCASHCSYHLESTVHLI